MSRFTIPSRCEFGVQNLDDQHHQLIEIINSLGDYLDTNDFKSLTHTFTDFRQLLVAHFGDEEALMAETDFPGTAEHIYHHKDLLHETDRLFGEILKRGRLIKFDIDECVDKILRHMLACDGPFNTHLHKIQYKSVNHHSETPDTAASIAEHR